MKPFTKVDEFSIKNTAGGIAGSKHYTANTKSGCVPKVGYLLVGART